MALLHFLIISFLFITSIGFSQDLSSKEILNKMFEAIENVQTLRFKLKKQERVNNQIKIGEQDVKFNKQPKKVYTYIQAPNKGVEVLFLEGKNSGNAYINPNAFPYINLHLDPYGSVMRKGNHHTVHEVGFDYVKGILKKTALESGEDFDKMFIYEGDVKFDNQMCYKMVVDYYPFKLTEYIVKADETITDIAYRLFLSDYMILELNKNLDGYNDVSAGDKITIPTGYARKTVLYINKQNMLPIVQIMYDDKGLFEQYEFFNLIVNEKIQDEEFTSGYKDYGF